MKPPRYPLASVLELRGVKREQARRALAEALGALAERERELAGSEAAREALRAETEDLERHLYDPDEAGLLSIPVIDRRTEGLKNVAERRRHAERTVEDCRRAVAGAEVEAGGCRERLLEADRELKAAEKHHDKWRSEWLREQARREQTQSEEITIARFAAEAVEDDGSEQGGET